MTKPKKRIIVVMGVSGSGKSTLGKALADKLGLRFIEGDAFHPQANVAKMSAGIPLDDSDRKAWLEALHQETKQSEDSAVMACSALKESYRNTLAQGMEDSFLWILMDGSYDIILDRMEKRPDHFMPPGLLKSQFETLEKPDNALFLNVSDTLEAQCSSALAYIKKAP